MTNALKSKIAKAGLGLVAAASMLIGAATVSAFTFNTNLKLGMKSADVVELQKALGVSPTSTNFGPKTLAAVKAYQGKVGLPTTGFVGALTRNSLNTGGGTPTGCTSLFDPMTGKPCVPGTTPPTTGPVSVMLSTDNPAAGNVISGQALADLAHFTFTGNGTVKQITLQRTGLSVSADVSNVYLFDGNMRLTDGASINTAGMVTFNNVNLSVAGSRTVAVKVDMAASTSSVNLGMTLTGFMTTDSTTAMTANLAGNLMYVSSAPTGITTATSNTAASTLVPTANINAGTMQYTVWSNSLNIGGRAASLKGLNLHYIGSAPTDSLANAKVFLDGTQIGTTATVSSAGYLFFNFGTGVSVPVSTHTLEVRADVMKGSNRNFQLSLQNASDLIMTDSQIGININATNAVTNGAAGTITVNPGSVTVTVDTSFNATTVTGGATNVTIAQYKMTAYGEDMKITQLNVTPNIASGTPGTTSMNNVGLYVNGGQVGSNLNFTGTALPFTLGSSLIIPAGTTVILTVKADTINATPANYTAGTLTVLLAGVTSNAQGMSSQNLTTAPATTGVTSSSLTIGAATATVALSTSLNSKNVISNTAKTKIGSFVVQAGTSEGVRVTNLQVGLVFGSTTAATYSTCTTLGGGATCAGNVPTVLAGTNNATYTFNSTVNLAVGDVLTLHRATTNTVASVVSITNSTTAVLNITTLGSGAFDTGGITGTSGPMTITNVSNLYTSDDTTNVTGNPTTSNNYSVNYTIAPSTSKTIDVYADLGGLNAGTIQSTLKITAVGSMTNVALTTGTGIATALNGQVMTVAAGSLATPTLTTASMVSQFVAGGTSPALATYNFVATNGDATINELKFTVTTTATAIDHVCVGTVCAPVISGVADIAGLMISVPAGYAGKDVVVTPTFSAVGIGQQTSNSIATMTLTYMKYQIGNVTTTNSSVSVSGEKAMTLVASYPTVTIGSSTRTGLSNTLVKLADITVAADTHGAIKLRQLPIITNSTGVATVATGSNNVTVKDGSGNVLNTTYSITNGTYVVASNNTSGSVSLVFGTPYTISAGTSVTFGIYATAATVSGAVNTTSLSTKLGTNTAFLFDDVNGNVTSIPANDGTNTNVVNYPVDASVITN